MRKIALILSCIILISCVRDPHNPVEPEKSDSTVTGALILCEGLWGMDNSSLSRYDFVTGQVISSIYDVANPGFKLGDLANNIVLKGDTAFIAVTTAKTIEVISVATGKSLGRMILSGNRAPRKICIVDDETAFVTDLYNNSLVEFSPRSLKIKGEIPVGPAPESVVHWGGYLFVSNSGYGDYLAGKPKAGTISVINLNSRTEDRLLDPGPNVIDIVINDRTGRLYAGYRHLPSKPDSLGGIVEYDLQTFSQLRHWRTDNFGMALSVTGDSLFFLDKKGVSWLKLNDANTQPIRLIENPVKAEIWYSLAVCKFDNTLWVGNARNYQTAGEIIIYNLSSSNQPVKRFYVGINPNSIVFFSLFFEK